CALHVPRSPDQGGVDIGTAISTETEFSLLRERLLFDLRRFEGTFRRLLRNRRSFAGLVIILFFVIISVGAPLFVGSYPNPLDPNRTDYLPMSWAHPLGTDQQGFDNLKLLFYGGRVVVLNGFSWSRLAVLVGSARGV